MTHQLTIRFDDELAEHIDSLAATQKISRNQAVLRLLREGAGLEKRGSRGRIGHSLDWFIGSATAEETRELEESLRIFETIDEEIWK